MNKIAQISVLHPRWDNRIFRKQAIMLKSFGEVYYFVADGLGNKIESNVSIIDTGKRNKNIIKRLFISGYKILKSIKKHNVKIAHIHDPELIPLGLILKIYGIKVVYDVHEDYPDQILHKEYINKHIRKLISYGMLKIESFASRYFDLITVASTHIHDRFVNYNKKTCLLANYPEIDDFDFIPPIEKLKIKPTRLLYVGTISRSRGVLEIIQSLQYLDDDVILDLAGPFNDQKYKNELMNLELWPRVVYHDVINMHQYKELAKSASIGIVNDYPLKNYLNAYATKMYEYMAAGLPIVISNFPNWVKFIELEKCGITTNPYSPKEIASSINTILKNQTFADQCGRIGRIAVMQKYSWGALTSDFRLHYSEIFN